MRLRVCVRVCVCVCVHTLWKQRCLYVSAKDVLYVIVHVECVSVCMCALAAGEVRRCTTTLVFDKGHSVKRSIYFA